MSKNLSLLSPRKCDCPQVLIVDDNAYNIMAMRLLLRQHKLTADEAINGKVSIDRVLARKDNTCEDCKSYKLIFMDLNMPVMNGYEATKNIRQMIELKEVPPTTIIAHTAFVHGVEEGPVKAGGFDGLLRKPVSSADVIDVLLKKRMIMRKNKK